MPFAFVHSIPFYILPVSSLSLSSLFLLYVGNHYGTSHEAISACASKGLICVLDIEIQGVRAIRQTSLNPVTCLISPPSFEVLESRLRGRGTDKEEAILKRLEIARRDMKSAKEERLFEVILMNDDLETAFLQLQEILNRFYPGKYTIFPTCQSLIETKSFDRIIANPQ